MRAFLQKFAAVLVTYGPWGIFLLAAIDSMGIPLPAAVDVIVLGVAAGSAHYPNRAWLAAGLAVLGSLAGNIVLYEAARHGRRLVGETAPMPGKPGRFRQWFHRYGLATVFIPAAVPFLPLPLKIFVISSGAMHVPRARFIAVILVGRLMRYFGEAWLGVELGHGAQGFLIHNGGTLAAGALGLAAVFYLVLRLSDRRANR